MTARPVVVLLALAAGCAYDPSIPADARTVCRMSADCPPTSRCLPLPAHESIKVCTPVVTDAAAGFDTADARDGAALDQAGVDGQAADGPIDASPPDEGGDAGGPSPTDAPASPDAPPLPDGPLPDVSLPPDVSPPPDVSLPPDQSVCPAGSAGCGCGAGCGTGLACVQAVCQPQRCSDGVISPGEDCDDSNLTPGDGCEPDCRVTPTVTVDPADGATGVAVSATITVTFSVPVNPATVSASSIKLTQEGLAVAGTVSYANGTAIFAPSDLLALAARYTLSVDASVRDPAGHPVGGKLAWTFTTRDGGWTANALAGVPNENLRLAVSPRGNAAVIWPATDAMGSGMFVGRFTVGAGWTTRAILQGGGTHRSLQADVAVDGEGNAVGVWEWYDAVYTSTSGPDGVWSAPATFSDGSAYHPRVVMPATGRWYSAWEETKLTTTVASATANVPVGGSTRAELSTGSGVAPFEVNVAMAAAAQKSVALWQQTTDMRSDVWANDTGFYTGSMVISDKTGNAANPAVDMDPAANTMAAWQQAGAVFVNIVAARKPNGGAWGAPVVVSDKTSGATNAQIAADLRGNFVAVWQQTDGPRNSVYAARWEPAGGWGAPVIISNRLADATLPHVALDGAGNGIAAWQQVSGTRTDVWTARFVAGAWQLSAVRSNGVDAAERPRVGLDRLGRGFVAWTQASLGAAVHRFE